MKVFSHHKTHRPIYARAIAVLTRSMHSLSCIRNTPNNSNTQQDSTRNAINTYKKKIFDVVQVTPQHLDITHFPVLVTDKIASYLSFQNLANLANAGHDGYALVDLYLSKKQDGDKEGNPAMISALHANLAEALIINYLARFPDELNRRNLSGDSVLTLAIKLGKPLSLISKLINMSDLNASYAQDNHRAHQTALHIAAAYGRIEVVELLMDAGVNINQTANNDRATALYYAKKAGHKNMQSFLKEHGAISTRFIMRYT